MTKVHKQRQRMISPMSTSKSTLARIEFKSDVLSATAWTEAYYASEAFERGRKGITDTQPHRPVKLSYSRRAAEEVLEDVHEKITHISEGLLGPEERRGDNEQWIMDLAEVEAVFSEAIKKTAVEPMRTVTVELTQADLDAIALGLSLSYDDQASYLQNGDPAVDYAEDLEDTKKFKANQFRGIAAVARRLGIYTQKKLWQSLAEEWESLEVDADDRERCEVCGAPLEPGQIGSAIGVKEKTMPQTERHKTTYEYDHSEAKGKVEFDSGNYGPCFVVTAPDGTQYTGFIDLFHFAKQGSPLQIVIDTPNHADGPTLHVRIWPDGRVETFRE